MASPSELLSGARDIVWFSRSPFGEPPPPESRGVALVCNLTTAPWTDLPQHPPSSTDRRDALRAGSAPRIYFAARRNLLKILVAWRIGAIVDDVDIAYDRAGAPQVATHPRLFVSVASRDALTALAIGPNPIGVDVEPMQADDPIYTVLHPKEALFLDGLPDAAQRRETFLRLWTMKEAYLKSLGCGFVRDPASVRVSETGVSRARIYDRDRTVVDAQAEWRSFPELSALAACFCATPRASG